MNGIFAKRFAATFFSFVGVYLCCSAGAEASTLQNDCQYFHADEYSHQFVAVDIADEPFQSLNQIPFGLVAIDLLPESSPEQGYSTSVFGFFQAKDYQLYSGLSPPVHPH